MLVSKDEVWVLSVPNPGQHSYHGASPTADMPFIRELCQRLKPFVEYSRLVLNQRRHTDGWPSAPCHRLLCMGRLVTWTDPGPSPW
jgi:hypothetical protein